MNYEKQKQYSKAIEYGRLATSQDPSNPQALYWLGAAYYHNKQYDEAIKVLEKRMALNHVGPQYSSSAVMLANAYDEKAWPIKDIQLLKKAMKLQPNNPKFHDHLGDAYLIAGQIQLAIGQTTEAVELAPDDSAYQNHLEALNERLGIPNLDDFIAPLKYDTGTYRGLVAFARWRTRMLIAAKNQTLPTLLRERITRDLTSLDTKIEQLILDLTHESELDKDRAQQSVAGGTANNEAGYLRAFVGLQRAHRGSEVDSHSNQGRDRKSWQVMGEKPGGEEPAM